MSISMEWKARQINGAAGHPLGKKDGPAGIKDPNRLEESQAPEGEEKERARTKARTKASQKTNRLVELWRRHCNPCHRRLRYLKLFREAVNPVRQW